jgi:hypothetical protein
VGGNNAVEGVWSWDPKQSTYVALKNVNVVVESGLDFDPIWIGAKDHGYIQFHAALTDLGLNAICDADFFVRSLSSATGIADGDLDVGKRSRCITVDSTSTPPIVAPPKGCTSDAQCAAKGLCINGGCVVPASCRSNADCKADEICNAQGFCQVAPSNMACASSADCGDLICDTASKMCVACMTDAACGAGFRCAVSGRCVNGSNVIGSGGTGSGGTGAGGGAATGGTNADPTKLAPGERIQGGAFTCSIGFDPSWQGVWAAAGVLVSVGMLRRRAGRGKVAS